MEEHDLYVFMKVCEDFVESSRRLANAAALAEDDSIKQDMIAFVVPDFHKMWARSEGIKILLESEDFSANKKFILTEMKTVTQQNLEIARKIKDKLGCLN